MAVKTYDYSTPSEFTYDNTKIEVSGGLAQLKITPDFTDLVGYWKLEDDYQDSSGLTRHGTPSGNPTFEDGKVDRCVNLDGIGDFVTFPNSFGLNVMTLTFWFKTSGTNQYLFSGGDAYDGYFYMQTGGTTALWAVGNNQTVVFTASLVNWNHVALVITGTNHLVYLNGNLMDSEPSTLDAFSGDYNLRMGARADDGSSPFNGLIDEVAIYNRVMELAEIQDLYNVGAGRHLTQYPIDKPTIEPTNLFDPAIVNSWDSFLETLGLGNVGSIGYNLYKVDKANKYYWNGSTWITGGSDSNYNSQAVITANIGTFDVAPDKIGFIAYLISDGEQVVELDENQITYSANTAPSVNAGSNKNCKDEATIAPFSDCSFSDIDGTVDHAYYKIDGEVDVWTEILQGGYGTLLEAVQAFNYQFSNTGTKIARLQAEDNIGATSEDSLEVDVQQFQVTFNIKDNQGNHIANIYFKPGDGTGYQEKHSPFTYGYDYNASGYDIVLDKSGYSIETQNVASTDHTENFTFISLMDSSDENIRIINAVYDTDGNMTSATKRVYRTAADCESNVNHIKEYAVTATYSNGTCTSYKQKQV